MDNPSRNRLISGALIRALALASCLSAIPADGLGAPQERSWRFDTYCMGTTASISIVATDSLAVAPLADRALAVFHRVDSLMSNWTDDSEVARINREAGKAALSVEAETATVIEAALRIGAASGGAFDITVEPLVRLWGFLGGKPRLPDSMAIAQTLLQVGQDGLSFEADTRRLRFESPGLRVDLGGIAKGHAVDAVHDSLRAVGIENALVNLSGNIRVLGQPPGRSHWRLGIRDPENRDRHFASIDIDAGSVATSGDYEQFIARDGVRYGHILDPRNGRPAVGLASVTVLAASAMTADAWATALIVMGPQAARQVAATRDDLTVMLLEMTEEGQGILWVESEVLGQCRIADWAGSRYRIRGF